MLLPDDLPPLIESWRAVGSERCRRLADQLETMMAAGTCTLASEAKRKKPAYSLVTRTWIREKAVSRPVLTPLGRFGSVVLASKAAGITRQAGYARVRSGEWQLDR